MYHCVPINCSDPSYKIVDLSGCVHSGLIESGVQVEPLVEAPAVDGGGLHLELGLQALVHQREQLLHVAVVRPLREHLAQHLDVPRPELAVAVRHQTGQRGVRDEYVRVERQLAAAARQPSVSRRGLHRLSVVQHAVRGVQHAVRHAHVRRRRRSVRPRVICAAASAHLEDEDLGHADERGQVEVVEVVDDVHEAHELAVLAAHVGVAGVRALVAVRRHHHEHALDVHQHRVQRPQRLRRLGHGQVEVPQHAEAELVEQVLEVVAVDVDAVAELLDVVVELHVREVQQHAAVASARAVQPHVFRIVILHELGALDDGERWLDGDVTGRVVVIG